MLRKAPTLQSKTLLLYLQRNYLNKDGIPLYNNSIERTLQRKVAKWRALHGNEKKLCFLKRITLDDKGYRTLPILKIPQ